MIFEDLPFRVQAVLNDLRRGIPSSAIVVPLPSDFPPVFTIPLSTENEFTKVTEEIPVRILPHLETRDIVLERSYLPTQFGDYFPVLLGMARGRNIFPNGLILIREGRPIDKSNHRLERLLTRTEADDALWKVAFSVAQEMLDNDRGIITPLRNIMIDTVKININRWTR